MGFVRFGTVGVLSLAADAGSLYVLHGMLHIWLALATALAYGVAFGVNFGLNRVWVFRSNGSAVRQLPRYLALAAANMAATVVAVPGLAWLGVPYMQAKLATAVVLAVANFFIARRWIFVSEPQRRMTTT